MKNQKRKFINVPRFIGNKETLNQYFESNLIYPKEALEKRIEGIIVLQAEVNDNGEIVETKILKGLAGGCNEEAIRLVKNLKYGSVKNKGIRLKSKKRFKIKFQLPPEKKISYELVKKKQTPENKSQTYSYTINIRN